MKKKMYYNMRIKTLKRNTSNVIRKGMEARLLRLTVRVRVRVRVRVTFPRLPSLNLIPNLALPLTLARRARRRPHRSTSTSTCSSDSRRTSSVRCTSATRPATPQAPARKG